MLILNTLPAAKGRRNMKAKLEPLSRSFCGGEPGHTLSTVMINSTETVCHFSDSLQSQISI